MLFPGELSSNFLAFSDRAVALMCVPCLCSLHRKWNIAQYQNIVFGEWFEAWHRTPLPAYTGYDDNETPDIDVCVPHSAFMIASWCAAVLLDARFVVHFFRGSPDTSYFILQNDCQLQCAAFYRGVGRFYHKCYTLSQIESP